MPLKTFAILGSSNLKTFNFSTEACFGKNYKEPNENISWVVFDFHFRSSRLDSASFQFTKFTV